MPQLTAIGLVRAILAKQRPQSITLTQPAFFAPLQIVFFGGSSADMATATTPASSSSYRINMAATNPTYLEEEMPSGRLMGDAVLMPDGTVGIFNGAQTGVHALPNIFRTALWF